jgi:acyl-CoA thioesterase FadM
VTDTPWTSWTGAVIEDWIGYNQHMSEGYYGLVFGFSTDEYLLRIGFDDAYSPSTNGAFYTAETHISFLNELALGTGLLVRTNVVGVDEIRLQLFHELVRGRDDVVAATQESLLLHVGTTVDQVGPMTATVLGAAKQDATAHAGLIAPTQIGKAIHGPSAS